MDKYEVIKIMGIIAVEFGALFNVAPERVALWERQLGEIDYRDGERAVMDLLGEASEFPPRVGEVRKRAHWHRRRRETIGAVEGSTRVLQLTAPHGMAEEVRQRCLRLLRDCREAIARKLGAT